MTLIGLRVTQYMYVLFDEVHIYIQKSQFTLALYVQKYIALNKHLVKVQGHIKLEILIIHVDENTSVIHGIQDILLLNATALSDFKKALRKKHTMQ